MTCTARVIDLARTADLIVHRLLALKPEEELLLVVDTESNLEMAYALAGAAARGDRGRIFPGHDAFPSGPTGDVQPAAQDRSRRLYTGPTSPSA